MEIEVPKDTTEKISKASKILGIKREELVELILRSHYDAKRGNLSL